MNTHQHEQDKTCLLSGQKDSVDEGHKPSVYRGEVGPTLSGLNQGGSTGSPERPQLPLGATRMLQHRKTNLGSQSF